MKYLWTLVHFPAGRFCTLRRCGKRAFFLCIFLKANEDCVYGSILIISADDRGHLRFGSRLFKDVCVHDCDFVIMWNFTPIRGHKLKSYVYFLVFYLVNMVSS